MSFNPNIPQNTDQYQQSYPQLRANFQAIEAGFNENHTSLTADPNTILGMHELLLMRAQSGDPTTSAIQIASYNKLVSSIPEWFYRPSSSATPIQMTYPSININPSALTQYSFIAGPFIIYGGYIQIPTNGQVVTLTPGTSLLYVDLIATNVNHVGAAFAVTAAPTNINTPANSFTISYRAAIAGSKFDLYYFAIGV